MHFLIFRFLPEFAADDYQTGIDFSSIPTSISVERYGTRPKTKRVQSQRSLIGIEQQQAFNLADTGLSPLPQGRAKCLLCAKEFSNMYNARTHLKELHSDKHNERKLHFCYVCGATFTVARSRLNHLMRKHGISQRMMKNVNYVIPPSTVAAPLHETNLNESISIKNELDSD